MCLLPRKIYLEQGTYTCILNPIVTPLGGWRVVDERSRVTGLKLWCFWSAGCGFESRSWHLCHLCASPFGWNVCKAVGPMYCVVHIKEPSYTYRKREGVCPGVSGWSGSIMCHLTMYNLQSIVLWSHKIILNNKQTLPNLIFQRQECHLWPTWRII